MATKMDAAAIARVAKHGPNPKKIANEAFTKYKARQLFILEQRAAGSTFQEIADKLDMYVSNVCGIYRKAMGQRVTEKADEIRKMEIQRLDGLQLEVYKVLTAFHPLVQQGRVVMTPLMSDNGLPVLDEDGAVVMVPMEDQSIKLSAVGKALSIMERRAKLLGLDAPTKVAATDPTGQKEAQQYLFYLPANGRDVTEAEEPIPAPT